MYSLISFLSFSVIMALFCESSFFTFIFIALILSTIVFTCFSSWLEFVTFSSTFISILSILYLSSFDIDILILIDDNKSISELRKLRHELEDDIDALNLSRSVDIKLYNKNRYIELSKEISFEGDIVKDLIDIRWWNYG